MSKIEKQLTLDELFKGRTRKCERCSRVFKLKKADQRFCSQQCAKAKTLIELYMEGKL